MNNEEKARRYNKAKAITQEWVDKQGQERCWYYPEIFRRLIKTLEITPSKEPDLPPRAEFESGCRRYQEEEYNQRKS